MRMRSKFPHLWLCGETSLLLYSAVRSAYKLAVFFRVGIMKNSAGLRDYSRAMTLLWTQQTKIFSCASRTTGLQRMQTRASEIEI